MAEIDKRVDTLNNVFERLESILDVLNGRRNETNREAIEVLETIVENASTFSYQEALVRLDDEGLKEYYKNVIEFVLVLAKQVGIPESSLMAGLRDSQAQSVVLPRNEYQNYIQSIMNADLLVIDVDAKMDEEKQPALTKLNEMMKQYTALNKDEDSNMHVNITRFVDIAELNNGIVSIPQGFRMDDDIVGNALLGNPDPDPDIQKEYIEKVGCVLTTYVRMARSLGVDISLKDANKVAFDLKLFVNGNELTPEGGATLINALLFLSKTMTVDSDKYVRHVKTIRLHDTLQEIHSKENISNVVDKTIPQSMAFVNYLPKLSEEEKKDAIEFLHHLSYKQFMEELEKLKRDTSKTYFVSVRVDTDNGAKNLTKKIWYEHTMNINSDFAGGNIFNDTSSANRTSVTDRDSRILKLDIFEYE